jgi:hypothetical protein
MFKDRLCVIIIVGTKNSSPAAFCLSFKQAKFEGDALDIKNVVVSERNIE